MVRLARGFERHDLTNSRSQRARARSVGSKVPASGRPADSAACPAIYSSRLRSRTMPSASAPTTQTMHQASHGRLGAVPENGLNL